MEKHVREVAEKLANAGYEPDHELLYLNEPGAGHVEKGLGRVGADRNGVTIEHRYEAAADGTVEIHVEQWR
ncbi:hypothetical protein [Paenibacillus donghaensis]|uniref:hypothetical protein n=1 Tax=Paenibacillus donghaensis TaxID=414771 RepID=UPI001883B47F|nr:hypothetical protein [Paenibacillus donghaensis]